MSAAVFSYPINYYCTYNSGICINDRSIIDYENVTFSEYTNNQKLSILIYFYDNDYKSNFLIYEKFNYLYEYLLSKKNIIENEDSNKIYNNEDTNRIYSNLDTILFKDENLDKNVYENVDEYVYDNLYHDNLKCDLVVTNTSNEYVNKYVNKYININLKDRVTFYYNFIHKFFLRTTYLIILLFSSFIISFTFIGNYIYFNMKNNKRYLVEEDVKKDEEDFYEFKYIEEYDNLDNEELDETRINYIKNKFITENTPKGIIHMSYNIDESAFIYYAKSSSTFSYKYLDCVARLFVIKFNCKKLYYHLHDEIIKSYKKINLEKLEIEDDNKEKLNDNDNREKLDFNDVRYSNTPSENDDSEIFVSLKSYNKVKNKSDSKFIDKKCNKFIFKGTLYDYDNLKDDKDQKQDYNYQQESNEEENYIKESNVNLQIKKIESNILNTDKKLNDDNKKLNDDNKKLNDETDDNKKLNDDNKKLNDDNKKLNDETDDNKKLNDETDDNKIINSKVTYKTTNKMNNKVNSKSNSKAKSSFKNISFKDFKKSLSMPIMM